MIVEPKKIKFVTTSNFSSSICHEAMGPNDLILAFFFFFSNADFQASFFTLFYPHQRLFSSSSLSDIKVIPSAYLRLRIFIPITFTPACDSFSLAFHMMHSA